MQPRDAAAVTSVLPDYAGMILSPGFRRSVSAETAAAIRKALKPEIPAVGVFVNSPYQFITEFAEAGIIQYIQLHGSEDAFYLRGLKACCRLPVIQAFRIRSAEDLAAAKASAADLILLDSGTGSGKTFDHALLKGFSRPYLLAGGLNAENIGGILAGHKPYGVDISSGAETDGQKDADKIRAFVKAVRGE